MKNSVWHKFRRSLAVLAVLAAFDGAAMTAPRPAAADPQISELGQIALAPRDVKQAIWVAPDGDFQSLAEAVAAAPPNATIFIRGGLYVNDFPPTIRRPLKIVGVDGRAHLKATQLPPNGVGIIKSKADLVVENLEFSGAQSTIFNGAGIKHEAGDLTVIDSYFHDNENGILIASRVNGEPEIRIIRSVFENNGTCTGPGCAHGIYVSRHTRLWVINSEFYGSHFGHLIKSRAIETHIRGTILDDRNSRTSYLIDVPNGGVVEVADNLLRQGNNGDNNIMVNFGTADMPYDENRMTVHNNRFENSRADGVAFRTHVPVTLQDFGNQFVGVPTITEGPFQ